ncbi:MAG: hypothetical protein SGJ18_03250 [Pseudomonadota bacterium]|nr:hypothetical protein [Pseudomonadota bacterium]
MKSLLVLTLSLFFFLPTGHTKVTTDYSDDFIVDFLRHSPEFATVKKQNRDLFKKAKYLGAEITRTPMADGLLSYEVNLQFSTEVVYRGKKHAVPMSLIAHTHIERYIVPNRRIVASKLSDPVFQKPQTPALSGPND